MTENDGIRIALQDVGVRFETQSGATVQALKGLNLGVRDQEFLTIVGPSGCGKSTTLRLISYLLRPSEGSVLIDGEPVTATPPSVGFMFQSDALFPWATVEKNIELGLRMRKTPREQRAERVRELTHMVGIAGFEDYYPSQLSGGMRKRVSLARIIAYDPDIYLMDEPFGALDAQTRIVVETQFLDIWEKLRKSVLFITHDIEEAVSLSDRVLVMSHRPGTIKQEIAINLPRPRNFYEIRFEDRFRELAKEVWDALRGEVDELAP